MDSRPSRKSVAAALRKTYPEHLRKSSDGQMLGDADAFLAALAGTFGPVIPYTGTDAPFVGPHPGCMSYDAPHRHAAVLQRDRLPDGVSGDNLRLASKSSEGGLGQSALDELSDGLQSPLGVGLGHGGKVDDHLDVGSVDGERLLRHDHTVQNAAPYVKGIIPSRPSRDLAGLIREGRKMVQGQLFGHWFMWDGRRPKWRVDKYHPNMACALGMALLADGYSGPWDDLSAAAAAERRFPRDIGLYAIRANDVRKMRWDRIAAHYAALGEEPHGQ